MTPVVEYTGEAVTDLAHIWLHHAERVSIRLADLLVQRIHATLWKVICKHPLAGRDRPELGDKVRSLPVVPYIVFYRIERRHVRVLRVLHGQRDVHQPLLSLLVAV